MQKTPTTNLVLWHTYNSIHKSLFTDMKETAKHLIISNKTKHIDLLTSLTLPFHDYNLALQVPCSTEIWQFKNLIMQGKLT